MADIKEEIFDFAYGAGLHDATNQKAYICKKGEKKLLRENQDAKNIVREYIDNIFSETSCDFYEVANRVIKSFNDFEIQNDSTGRFTFGNAQKLINITVKFMYISIYANPNLRNKFSYCHCPLDEIIGRVVKKRIKKELVNKNAPDDIKEIINKGTWKSWDGAWSRITEESYRDYQAVVLYFSDVDNVLPVEFDYFNW